MAESESAALIRSLPWRDRIPILTLLAVVTLLAWVYLVDMALGMSGMMASGSESMMQIRPWTASYFISMLLMWIIMMVGMMVPTAIPMALVYAAVSRKAARQGATLAPTSAFVSGYVVMWGLFSVAATVAQWGLDGAALLSPMLVTNSPVVGGTLLVAAGLYQMTPMKNACLRHCRSPAHFISQSWKPGAWGAFRMGLEHGAYCFGCCWILMGLLFFGGVMSLLWIAGITIFVLLEKVLPFGNVGGRLAGGAMGLCGVIILVLRLIPCTTPDPLSNPLCGVYTSLHDEVTEQCGARSSLHHQGFERRDSRPRASEREGRRALPLSDHRSARPGAIDRFKAHEHSPSGAARATPEAGQMALLPAGG